MENVGGVKFILNTNLYRITIDYNFLVSDIWNLKGKTVATMEGMAT